MSSNVVNQVPFLRVQREYPEDLRQLTVEVNKTYVDVANAVNNRTISLFPTSRPAINGESWFVNSNRKNQGFRQVYSFTSTGNIPHGLNYNSIDYFTKCTGSFTDGTNWYAAIFGSNVAIAGQISFYVAQDDIVVLAGAGAPTIDYGLIVLEWITNT